LEAKARAARPTQAKQNLSGWL